MLMLQSTEDAGSAAQLEQKMKQLQTSGILDDELVSFLWKDVVGRTKDKQEEVGVLFQAFQSSNTHKLRVIFLPLFLFFGLCFDIQLLH